MNTIKINNVPSNIKARATDVSNDKNQKWMDKYFLAGFGIIIFWTIAINYKYNKGTL